MKYKRDPKEENGKYPTNSSYIENGTKSKRTPDNQSRGKVKRRKDMTALVSEALEALECSDNMTY